MLWGRLTGTRQGASRADSTYEPTCAQDLLGALVHAGPTAPVASLPVLSEMIRRLDALDGMDSGIVRLTPERTRWSRRAWLLLYMA